MASPVPCRSVLDYDTEESLRRALLGVDLASGASTSDGDKSPSITSEDAYSRDLDWVLPLYDPETTNVQSMREELKRLQVLKSYAILDAEREKVFERITGLAARLFKVPIALVSLVDLGRQWFMSNRGLGDVRETPRNVAFCAHAIMLKQNMLVVPDASKDFRFQNNPLVTGPPNIRFYAGAPLICAEGYKLGTLCIISGESRPQGLSEEEQDTLKELAELVVDAMASRRRDLHRGENPAQLIACTAHDIMTPLTGVQLSLSLLKDDDEVAKKLGPHQMELLTTASASSELLIRICRSAIDELRTNNPDSSISSTHEMLDASGGTMPVTKMDDLMRSLHMLMEPMPKSVPMVIRMDSDVPPMVLCDDLKLFRSALNLLSSAAGRTKQGGIQLHIKTFKGKTELLFECEDTADNIPVEEYQYLFQPSGSAAGNLRICLASVASLISSVDGEYGFRPRVEARQQEHSPGWQRMGSIFWFSVPLFAPESLMSGKTGESKPASAAPKAFYARPSRLPPKSPILPKVTSHHSISSLGKGAKLPLLVGDILQADAVANSCFRDVFAPSLSATADANRQSLTRVNSVPSIPENITIQHAHSEQRDDNGRNSTFSRLLSPIAKTFRENGMPADTRAGSRKAKEYGDFSRIHRVLVIDDSLVIRKSLAMALRKLGFEADVAVDGMEGLTIMKEREFDFVLCDFLMPVLDGLDCVKQFREWEIDNRQNSRQIIIGISAHADSDVAKRGVAAGMDNFLPKPISIKTLTAIIESDSVRMRSQELDKSFAIQAFGDKTKDLVSESDRDWRKRESDDDVSGSDDGEGATDMKRARFDGPDQPTSQLLCLLATDHPNTCSRELFCGLESNNWKVVIVHDGADTLRLLKTRNWDLVLIDDCLTGIDSTLCANQFRHWENENRVNRQKRVLLVSSYDIPSPSDRSAIVLAPVGYDHVIRKPVEWKDLQQYLSFNASDMAIVR